MMNIRKAGIDDIDILIKLRVDFLLEEKSPFTKEELKDIKEKLKIYFAKWISNCGFIAFIAEENGEILSTAFLSIVERPPRNAFSSYLVGTVFNVFTYEKHRRKGVAGKVMTALLDEAKKMNIASVDLLATDDGKYLYEKLGFGIIEKYTSMNIKLDKNK